MAIRTQIRHVKAAQATHKALRHETVDTIRAMHQRMKGTLSAPVTSLVGAYRDQLAKQREDAGEDAPAVTRVPASWLSRNQHVEHLKSAAHEAVRTFASQALAATVTAKQHALYQASEDAGAAIEKAVRRVPAAKRPPVEEVRTITPEQIRRAVTTTGNGANVSTLYDGMDDECADAIGRATSTAVQTGATPDWLALALASALNLALYRALTIARNETLDTWRTVQLDIFVANRDYLRAWVWHADLASCCTACALMHGSVHDMSEDLDGHVNCKCTAVPLAIGDDSENGGVERGYSWLSRQDDDVLQDKLGPAAFNAYKAGDVTLDQFLKTTNDREWGTSIYQASLRDLGLDASDYLS